MSNKPNKPNKDKEQHIIIPIDVITGIPNIEDIAVFPNKAEALKAKAFMKKASGNALITILIPVVSYLTKDDWVEDWQERLKDQVCESVLNSPRESSQSQR